MQTKFANIFIVSHKLRTLAVFVLIYAVMSLNGCAPKPENTIESFPQEKLEGDFSGWVTNTNGVPISTAVVTVNESSVRTNLNGSFSMNLPTSENYRMSIKHENHADFFFQSKDMLKQQVWKLPPAYVRDVDPTQPITLIDERWDLVKNDLDAAVFSLPPNALVDENGDLPVGPLRAAIATLDLSKAEGPNEWRIVDDLGQDGYLVSYGAVFIEFSDPSSGKTYQIKDGMKGNISIPVPPNMNDHVGAALTAPLWYYDEATNLWEETGSAIYDPATNSYKGSIDHLSTINTDIAKTDAACLAVTLDTSVPAGYKLRVRYHSGGTAFGQVKTIVMNDPLNAIFRLPENTNVLLELLTSSDAPIGNFVVEDPPATDLANTVVNAGPASTPHFPPSPYANCKPITVKIEEPEVEIRINERPIAALPTDNPTDDYLTWAPTYALARLNGGTGTGITTVHLANDSPNPALAGNVRFANYQAPWPVNTTASTTSLNLSLPNDGSWVPFMIAGEFNSPSHNDKDTIIEAHLGSTPGTVIGTKALMVRVRKDANTLEPAERDRFLFAFRKFRNQTTVNNYLLAQEIHRLSSQAGDEAHGQPAFLTWHRAFLLFIERELQKIDPSVALHYWDWDSAAPNVFSEDFLGRGCPVSSPGSGCDADSDYIMEPVFALTNPYNGWDTNMPFSSGELRRSEEDHTRAPGTTGLTVKPLIEMMPLVHGVDESLLQMDISGTLTPRSSFGPREAWPPSPPYPFSNAVEWDSHNPGHGWPCASGHLITPNRSSSDPIFYLLHSQIDRQWAYWQKEYDRHGAVNGPNWEFPAPDHYDNNGTFSSSTNWQQGSFLDDGLWPWDGSSGGGFGRTGRPANTGRGFVGDPNRDPVDDVTSGGIIVPSTAFEASQVNNLWPITAVIPRNRDFIDYTGRANPVNGLGFGYDDVDY